MFQVSHGFDEDIFDGGHGFRGQRSVAQVFVHARQSLNDRGPGADFLIRHFLTDKAKGLRISVGDQRGNQLIDCPAVVPSVHIPGPNLFPRTYKGLEPSRIAASCERSGRPHP